VRAIITLGHNLGLKVVAEGVEHEDQRRFLRLNKCDEAQGFLFCRPIEAKALAELLPKRT
jgi:EAL domain-containing protein (putative c-di-GMP-specific phosphodiesterase class I)